MHEFSSSKLKTETKLPLHYLSWNYLNAEVRVDRGMEVKPAIIQYRTGFILRNSLRGPEPRRNQLA